MAEPGGERLIDKVKRGRKKGAESSTASLVEEHDKDGDKKLDSVELKTALEMEVLEGDLDGVKKLRELEKAGTTGVDAVKLEKAKKQANLAADVGSGAVTVAGATAVAAGTVAYGAAVGTAYAGSVIWRGMKVVASPFVWVGKQIHDKTVGFLRSNDEFGFIERTEDWFQVPVEKEKKEKKEKK